MCREVRDENEHLESVCVCVCVWLGVTSTACEPPGLVAEGGGPASGLGTAEEALQNYPSYCAPGSLLYDTAKTCTTDPTRISVAGVGSAKALTAWDIGGTIYYRLVDHNADPYPSGGSAVQVSDGTYVAHYPSVTSISDETSNRVAMAWDQTENNNTDIRLRTYYYTDGYSSLTENQPPAGTASFVANVGTTGEQVSPSVQYLWGAPGFVVAWWDKTSHDVEFRTCGFGLGTSCSSADLLANSYTGEVTTDFNYSVNPRMDAFDAGGFVMVWQSNRSTGAGDSYQNHNVYLRRFSAYGTPLDSQEIMVSTDSTDGHDAVDPDVAVLDEDRYVVVWMTGDTWNEQPQVAYRIYTYGGSLVANGTLGSGTAKAHHLARVASFKRGFRDWAVAWVNVDLKAISLRHFDYDGNSIGPTNVATSTLGYNPSSSFHDLDAMQCNSFAHAFRWQNGTPKEGRLWYPKLW